MSVAQESIDTKVPARMDRLPWSRWHWLIILALGTVWVLDGLEVTIKGAVGPSLKDALGFSTFGVAGLASIYLLGAVSGALFWGYLTDRFGRKNLFIITIAVYMVGVIGTSVTGLWIFGDGFEYAWFGIFRFITGFGIGGEYAAVNSAIDELMPARVRGRVALAINGSYWLGTAVGAIAGAVYLNVLPQDVAFRAAFGMGLVLALGITALRLFVPESPRWLMTHGYVDEAEKTVEEIEEEVKDYTGVEKLPEVPDEDAITLRERRSIGFVELGRTLFSIYPRRSTAGFMIMLTQAFLYNAIFFTFGLMLTTFFDVSTKDVGLFLIPFAVGNFLGPILLGPLFDSRGRKTMIPLTFGLAGSVTFIVGLLFASDVITAAWLMTLCWVVIFFFASAGASAGYLTISETFPLEVRAMAIAFFYAIATGVGGILGPILYGALISSGSQWSIFWGYALAGVLMITGGIVHRVLGVEAAQEELEDVAAPLSQEEAEGGEEEVPELEGPAGIDPADAESVRGFQREHDLEPDGVIGPETAGALRAELAGGSANGELDLDVSDTEAIRRFQREYGLEPDGMIDEATRGAIRFDHARAILDPASEEEVAEFQRAHGLEADGVIGPRTQAALASVRSERHGSDGADAYLEVDPLDAESVERFQRSSGLSPDGVIGGQTRGALRAQRSLRERNDGLDPASAESIEAFQRRHEQSADGVIGPRTREALAEVRERERAPEPEDNFGVDPVRVPSVKRFQRAVGLEADGCIGPETRRALRAAPHLLIGVDPTDENSIRRFQEANELVADGIIGPETQGALAVAMGRRVDASDGDETTEAEQEARRLDGLIAFDPSDREAIVEFQREHDLEADGLIGPRTRAALRAALIEEERALIERPRSRGARPWPRRTSLSSIAPTDYSLPESDREFDRNLAAIETQLREHGPLEEKELRERVRARLWGPGRFKYVLGTALEEGAIRKVGRHRYKLS